MLDVDVKATLGSFMLDVQMMVPADGITALFGPSGSGKTTLLRIIAGFQDARGRITARDSVWLDSKSGINLPAHQRSVGYLFQEGRLFPHLNVLGNLKYALRRATPSDAKLTLEEVAAAFDLDGLLARRVDLLSGGERQRVALARTLLTQPDLVLLDEPLAALDAQRKAEILPYLEGLSKRFAGPTIYVSHAVDEVAVLTDRMIVMTDGCVRAQGATAEILEGLDVHSVTGRFEAGVVVEARVTGHESRFRLALLDLAGQSISMPMQDGLDEGRTVRIRIRSRDVALANREPVGLSIRNVLAARVIQLVEERDSAFAEVLVEVGAGAACQRLRASITRAAVEDLGLTVGAPVFALIKSVTFDGHNP